MDTFVQKALSSSCLIKALQSYFSRGFLFDFCVSNMVRFTVGGLLCTKVEGVIPGGGGWGELKQTADYWNTLQAVKDSKRHNEDADKKPAGFDNMAIAGKSKSTGEQNDSAREEKLLCGILINFYFVCLIFYQTSQ